VDGDMTGTPADGSPGRERSGRLTTMIPRPTQVSDAGRPRPGDARGGDGGDRISSRRSAWLFGLAALVIVAALAAALFGLPVRTWFEQDDRIDALQRELDELQSVNDDLTDEVARLQSDAGIREAAREELGQVDPGDRRHQMPALPDLPRDFPTGWPYSQAAAIIRLRTEEATAAASPTTAAPSPMTPIGEQPAGTEPATPTGTATVGG